MRLLVVSNGKEYPVSGWVARAIFWLATQSQVLNNIEKGNVKFHWSGSSSIKCKLSSCGELPPTKKG